MNKQQLASKIWQSTNKMRSKIEANEYKEYIFKEMLLRYICPIQKFLHELFVITLYNLG